MNRTYLKVYAALVTLTLATVALSYVPLGAAGPFAAYGIAAAKALLIGCWFMHLMHAERLVVLPLIAFILWLLFITALSLSDYLMR